MKAVFFAEHHSILVTQLIAVTEFGVTPNGGLKALKNKICIKIAIFDQ